MGYIYRSIGSHLIALLFWGCIFGGFALAGNIKQPPIIPDIPIQMELYLQEIADNFNVLQEVTSEPNGNVRGRKNEIVIYNDDGTREIWVNTTEGGGTTWQQL